eukprot:g1045.t1
MSDEDKTTTGEAWYQYTKDEEGLIAELKKRCADVTIPNMDCDEKLTLLRFVRARQGDMDKVEKMLRDTIAFRKESADDIFTTFSIPEVLEKYFPGSIQEPNSPCFLDKIGRPIVYEALGQVDPSGIVNATKAGGPDFMARYNTYNMEHLLRRCRSLTKKSGKPVSQVVIVEDVAGLGSRHLFPAGLALFGKLTRIMEDYYPEIMGITFVVNAPRIFSIIWSIVKKFFDERTREKIHILGTDYLPTMLKYIDKSQIPKELGGDSTAMTYPPQGGIIPEKYFEPSAMGFTKVCIGRRDHDVATVTVKKGDRAFWEWHSERDVGFDLTFSKAGEESDDDKKQEVHAWERSTDRSGMFVAKADGQLAFHFDNRFSMMRGKEVTYKVQMNLVMPKGLDSDDAGGASASTKTDEKGE